MDTAAVVVTGGAGFVGSHLCRRLLDDGAEVVAVDNLSTGRVANVGALVANPRFHLVEADVSAGIDLSGTDLAEPIAAVAHFASPASPVDYLRLPIETLTVNSAGTHHALELALRHGARFVMASTSEIYGDPVEHPQTEAYWGNVNPIGPRSVYDEAKRFAEALTMAYQRTHGLDVGIIRLFNTYGPGMRPRDGRVVSNLVVQALSGEPLTVYGDGTQTRSFCYIDDEIDGISAMLHSDLTGPVNLGNPDEFTMLELADVVLEVTGSASPVELRPLPVDDPAQRKPDISLASEALGWCPATDLRTGVERTAAWFASHLAGA